MYDIATMRVVDEVSRLNNGVIDINRQEFFKLMRPKGQNKTVTVLLLNGQSVSTPQRNIRGFCHCKQHKGYISKSLLKTHDCINKKCVFFERVNKAYWEVSDKYELLKPYIKQQRKEKKKDTEPLRWKEMAQNIADSFNYNIVITSVRKLESEECYTVFYISEWEYNDAIRFLDFAYTFGYIMESRVFLKHVKELDGSFAVI